MDHSELRAWCDARRGRLSELARALGIDRQFVWQWAQGKRPIPAERLPVVRHEMRRTEAIESAAQPQH
jgi:DNA-binding transcriptional regulator YdaS (Cro superfamily)